MMIRTLVINRRMRQILYRLLVLLPTWPGVTACTSTPDTPAPTDTRSLTEFYADGRRHLEQHRHDSALFCFMQAEQRMEGESDNQLKIRVYSNLGFLLAMNKIYAQSLEYYREALRLSEISGDSLSLAYAHAELGKTYALNHADSNSYKSLYHLDRAVAIKPDNRYLTGYVFLYKGMYYHYKAANDSALHYLNLSLQHPAEGVNAAILYSVLGHTYLDMEDKLDSAEHYLKLSLQSPHTFRLETNCYNALYKIAQLRKDTQAIDFYAGICLRNKDSIMQMEDKMKAPILKVLETNWKEEEDTAYHAHKPLRPGAILLLVILGTLPVYTHLFAPKKKEQAATLPVKNKDFEVALEKHRQEWVKRLQKALQPQDTSPYLGKKHKMYVCHQCEELLHIDDWEVFSAFFNEEFNGFVHKIKRYYESNSPQTRSTIKFCCLMLLEVSKENIEIILNYTHPDAYRKRCNLLNSRFTDKMKNEDLHAFLIRLMKK